MRATTIEYMRGYTDGFNARPEIKADWVSVDDELPTDDDCYIIAWKPGYHLPKSMKHLYAISEYDPEHGWSESRAMKECNNYEILAWTSLPAEYEEEDDD